MAKTSFEKAIEKHSRQAQIRDRAAAGVPKAQFSDTSEIFSRIDDKLTWVGGNLIDDCHQSGFDVVRKMHMTPP